MSVLLSEIVADGNLEKWQQDLLDGFKVSKIVATTKPKIDEDLVTDCMDFSRDSDLKHDVCNLVSLYKSSVQLCDEEYHNFSFLRKKKLCEFIKEIEKSLHNYLDHGFLSERKLTIKSVLEID